MTEQSNDDTAADITPHSSIMLWTNSKGDRQYSVRVYAPPGASQKEIDEAVDAALRAEQKILLKV